MNTDDGTLSFGTAVDMSGFDEGAAHIEEKVNELGTKAEEQTSRLSELLTNVPDVNIEVVTNASQSLATIDQAFAEIDRVVDTNKSAIVQLEAEYKRLGIEANKAYQSGDDKSLFALQEQRKAIEKVINARKRVNAEAAKTADQLVQTEAKLKKENETTEEAVQKHTTLRQQIKALKEEMATMVAEGVDQQSAAYKNLVNELGRLQDIQGDISQQGKVLANDEQNIAGIIQGLSGLSGAFTAAQGAVSLFAGENEELNKIMLKVQSLMAITMGLQQVQQTLNKDSAFSLVTLNKLKEYWNKLMGEGTTVQTAETVATEANTAAQAGNAAATVADTTAQTENNVATGAGTVAQVENTTMTIGQTVATWASVAATKAATIAMKGLKLAIAATGIGLIVVAIGELVSWLMSLADSANEAEEAFKEQEEVMQDGRKAYAQASAEISSYTQRIETFNGTKRQEKKLVEELNQKYGSALGYYDSLAKWKDVLTSKGEVYCQMLLKEAEAQAILNKYTEAFIAVQETKDKAQQGEYDHWYNTKRGDEISRQEAIDSAQAVADKWLEAYKAKMAEADQLKSQFNLGGYTAPSGSGGKGGKGGKNGAIDNFDPVAAARNREEAIKKYQDEVAKYYKEGARKLDDIIVAAQKEGQVKELNQIRLDTNSKLDAWEDQITRLAEIRKQSLKEVYMSQKGATENGWFSTADGKRSIEEYAALMKQEAGIKEVYERVKNEITEQGEKKSQEIRQKYTDQLIDLYGTPEQKFEKLQREWQAKLAYMPSEFLDEATKQMDQAFSQLDADKFKKSINWEGVFGDMGKQATESLQVTLDKIRTYFDANKDTMSTEEIKDFQEAIVKMEDEIANRNPFSAFHKGIKDIANAKAELVAALNDLVPVQQELKTAQDEYNSTLAYQREILTEIENGTLTENCEQQIEANERLTTATQNLSKAQEKNATSEQRVLNARNNLTSSYKNFANSIKNVGGVIKDVGTKAKGLASVFSDDVSDGIGKAIDFVSDVLDATESVITAIGDTGKAVASGIETTVQSAASGSTAAAAAGATAISTIEKASVILAVISAALQVATAIANLFNNDDEKQKEIENLQRRIDSLQWELDNQEAVRLQERVGNAVTKLKEIYQETSVAVLQLHNITQESTNKWQRYFATLHYSAEIYEKTIESIADAYAKVSYTADKALGEDKYASARRSLENLAEQQILIQKQIDAEEDKKKTDHGKIDEWTQKIQEIAEEMASLVNEMLEEIIGYSAEDLAKELGDAFFEAAAQGEDAMEAWRDKANEIIQSVLKQMLVTKFLEQPIGEIFDKYKAKWFGQDGTFKGIDSVIDSMTSFSADIMSVGSSFNEIWKALPEEITSAFTDGASRSAEAKGIATASQDSVDENNARLTTIQGHTFTLVQGMAELNATSNAILDRLTGIERNTDSTNDKLDNVRSEMRRVRDGIEDINTKGVKLLS